MSKYEHLSDEEVTLELKGLHCHAASELEATWLAMADMIKGLEVKLAAAESSNKVLEKLVDDFDGSVRHVMQVAPQLEHILKQNLKRIKGEKQCRQMTSSER